MNEIITNMELFPVPVDEDNFTGGDFRVPIDEIAALGTGFDSIVAAIQNVFGKGGTVSGLYKVTIPKGGHLAGFKDGSGYLGTVLKSNNQVGGGQARLNPLACDPTTLCMAVALASVERKLDAIQETQQEILQLLEQKEKAELRGDLLFLSGIMENYKYNWDNDQYKSNNHIKALDVKQNAEQAIHFAKSKIEKRLAKNQMIYGKGEVKKIIQKLSSEFDDYQMAVYLYAMASYVEVILLGNFDPEYLASINKKINAYAIEYRNIYTKCYDKLEGAAAKSVSTVINNSIATIIRDKGDAIREKPLVNLTPVDDLLIDAGNKITDSESNRNKKLLSSLVSKQSSYVEPFVEAINVLGKVYGTDLEISFNKDTLYIGE